MVERILVVEDEQEKSNLWEFYDRVFEPVNKETPISQTWPKKDFIEWLSNKDVIKFVAKDIDRIIGLGFVTEDLSLEPLLSFKYFKKHHPNNRTFYFPVIAIDIEFRKGVITESLLKMMMSEISADGIGILLNSDKLNQKVPALAFKTGGENIIGTKEDSESCYIFQWKK